MSRIEKLFADCRAARRRALMPFVTAGHPSTRATAAILPALQRGGAMICELGIPFSDPIADGPVIQASMTDALAAGVTPQHIFETVSGVRSQLDIGLVAMVSFSIVYRIGLERFVQQAAQAGFDGFIFPDLPLEEAPRMADPVRAAGMTCSLLVAPTTPIDRATQIARASSGFVYVVARTGITGEQSELPTDLAQRLARLRDATDLPIAVGFGISQAEHVRAVTQVADAAIVGSALVKRLGQSADRDLQALADEAERFVAELCGGLV